MTSTDDVRALFNRIAPVYDDLNDRLSLGLHRVWKQMAVSWSGARPGDTCLDICCGSGDLTQLLARRVGKAGKVIGLDFSTRQLEIAQKRLSDRNLNLPIYWQEGDALDLPFTERSFDAITMGYGLRNVGDIPRSLAEIHRILKPGCIAAILDFNHSTNPQVQAFQRWYLEHWVVPAARQLGMADEYAYIMPSLERFPTGTEQVNLARQVGFSTVIYYPIAGGTMGVLLIQK
jgi:demethylmenaquinone methyltransferase/2-methoxy-6-polyprenyl-1,4-benzoquinol methylase